MANGEGVVEDVLVRGRYDGTEIEKGIPASIDKGIAASARVLTEGQKQVANYAKALLAGGATLRDLQTEFKSTTFSAEDLSVGLREAGLSAGEINTVLGKTTTAAGQTSRAMKETDWSAKSMGKSVEWAAYRFITTLAIYMAFRKVLRTINEAITTSIRLWKEYTQAQNTLRASLEVNKQLLGDQVATQKEWNDFINESSRVFGSSQTAWANAVNTALEYNATVGKSTEELKSLINLGLAVAQMWKMYDGDQLDVARGTRTVMEAIRGQESALLKLATREEDVAASVSMTVEQFHDQTDAFQESVRWAYIVENRYDAVAKAATEGMTDIERRSSLVVAANDNLMVSWGKLWNSLAEAGRIARLVTFGPLVWLTNKLTELNTASDNAAYGLGVRFRKAVEDLPFPLSQLALSLQIVGALLERLAPDWLKAEKAEVTMADTVKTTAEDVLAVASAWGRFHNMMAGAQIIIDRIKGAFGKIKDMVPEISNALENLANQLFNVIQNARQAQKKAYESYIDNLNKLNKDEIDRREDIEKNYADKAADLRKRAAKRIEDAREDAARREEDDREDLLLRLKHMEEDHLLDLLQMRREYEMGLEEAARARDAVAIRRLQRQYALQRKEREEDYSLSRKQYIESWEQQHRQNQEDLKEELKQIQDNLAEELAELEAAKIEELEELRASYAERRQELLDQYNEQMADLKRSNQEQLAEILARAVAEGDITKPKAEEITKFLADEYGYREEDITNFVNFYLEEIARLEAGVLTKAAAIASAMQAATSMAAVSPMGGAGGKHFAMAEGGMALATAPTMVKVGEAGPELFGAIPLAKGGALIGGLRSQNMDVRLTIDGTQSGAWSGDFETQVLRIFRGLLRESL